MGNFDAETIVVPERAGNNSNDFLIGMLSSACQQKGIDPNAVLAMCNNNGRNGGFNGFGLDGIIALIVVAAIFGNGNGGGLFGGNNNRNSQAEQMLMDAIQRNGIDISQLASTLNCSMGQIQTAIQNVATQICGIGNQVGMSAQQIINAVQQGNMALTQQLCNCCCDIKSAILESNYLTERGFCNTNQILSKGFSDIGYATRDQTCAIEKAIASSTEAVLAGQRAAEMREMQREIAERDRRIAEQSTAINNYQQTQTFANMISGAIGPVTSGLAALGSRLAGIECRLPETKVISCPDNYVRVNTDFNIPVHFGANYCGGGYPYGGYPYGGNPYDLCGNRGWG